MTVAQWYCWWFRYPANQLRLVVYPIIYRVLYIPGGDRRISSTNSIMGGSEVYGAEMLKIWRCWNLDFDSHVMHSIEDYCTWKAKLYRLI